LNSPAVASRKREQRSINLETRKPERGKLDSFSGFMASEFNQILWRPNPLGLHPVTVREIDGTRVKIGPIEAFDGTPVVDIKSASTRAEG
jgi:tRNA (Thr-GGU) A37 N-methylase